MRISGDTTCSRLAFGPDGNLYVTRYGKGTVAKVSPKGEVLREIDVLGARPSNICFVQLMGASLALAGLTACAGQPPE